MKTTTETNEYTHLQRWTHPDCYMGEEYPEFYVVYGQHRDSDLLTQSNFETIKTALQEVESDAGIPTDGDCTVQITRAGHWAVGWIETILVHESDTAALEKAEELLQRIADYPVLDDEDFYRREEEYARQVWESFTIRDRVEYLQRANKDGDDEYSIFAARRDEMPYTGSDSGYLQELLTTD